MRVSKNSLSPTIQMTSSGFTLIELMVTIAVLAIIVGIAAPSISSQLANQRVKSTVSTLENALKEAKVESVIRRQPLTLTLDSSNKLIKIQHLVLDEKKIIDEKKSTTIASYKYNTKSTIKPDSSSTEFNPGKIASVTTYTICDSNVAASPLKVEVSATAVISTKSEGTCP